MADLDASEHPDGPMLPTVRSDWEKAGAGEVHDAVRGYLQEWMVAGNPGSLLRAVSVKAYPCVAEFRDGSRPDSKLALYRIMQQMRSVRSRVGRIDDLTAAIEPVDFPLPGATPVNHPYANLFSLQMVPDDVAWAMDCRMRFGLKMAEAVPQPGHKMNGIYVSAWRIRKSPPNEFRLYYWAKQGNDWKIVSFDIKHHSTPIPPDIVARTAAAAGGAGARTAGSPGALASGDIEAAATRMLDAWLVEKKPEEAVRWFAPSSYACRDLIEGDVSAALRSDEAGRTRLLEALQTISSQVGPATRLEDVIAAPEVGHPEIGPIAHARAGAYLLNRVSDDIVRMYSCTADGARRRIPKAQGDGAGKFKLGAYMTATRWIKADGDSPTALLYFWEKRAGEWRVVSYALVDD